jgi:hypothetical protein
MSRETTWYFVYTCCPDGPSVLKAVFWSISEADVYRDGNGYLEIRRALWEGYGSVPDYSETEKV